MKKLLTLSTIAFAIISCTKTQFTAPAVSTGSANFTKFVSVGNSLTQGYMDGGLYFYGQSNSYPSIIAKQAQDANFNQPMVTGNGSGYIHLAFINNQLSPIQPSDSTFGPPINPDPSWVNWGTSLQSNSYCNLGISGITLDNTVALTPTEALINSTICANNPYGRFMSFGSFASPKVYIDNLRTCGATFFTCWLGSNDVLGYATAGGVPTVVVTFLGKITLNAITSPAIFAQKYDSILTVFNKMGAKGVCATIPDVTSIPFFNTVPSYVTVNGNKQFLYIRTAAGVRQATTQDHILLTAYDSVLAGKGLTASNPLSNPLVLDASEVDSIEIALAQYNSSIKSLAASFGFPVVDMYQYLGSLQQSIYVDGITFNRTFIQGGAIGLDGIHPDARGYALVANQFIQVINASFGATIPPADVTQFRGVLFP